MRMPADRIAHRRLAAVGLAGVIAMTLTTTIAAIAYEGAAGERYALINHWISELGEYANSELAWLFNAGLVVGGLAMAVFMLGVGRVIGHGWGGAIAVAGAIAGVSGALVGVFSMDQLQAHGAVALLFFFSAPIAIGIFTAWLIHLRPDDVPRSLIWPGLFTIGVAAAFLTLLFFGDTRSLAAPDERPDFWLITILEWLVLIGILAWTAALSAVLWQGRAPDKTDR
jgi:hypothetical membrane protein